MLMDFKFGVSTRIAIVFNILFDVCLLNEKATCCSLQMALLVFYNYL